MGKWNEVQGRIQCSTVQHNTTQYNTIQYNTIQLCSVLHGINRLIVSISTLQEVDVELGVTSNPIWGRSALLQLVFRDVVAVALVVEVSLPDSLCDSEIMFLMPHEAGVVDWGWDWGRECAGRERDGRGQTYWIRNVQ